MACMPAALANEPRTRGSAAGWEAVQKAKALQPPTEREQLFVAAAEGVFSRTGVVGLLAPHSSLGAGHGEGLQRLP
jgi:hypothetical protein